jgi:hypothetical protein
MRFSTLLAAALAAGVLSCGSGGGASARGDTAGGPDGTPSDAEPVLTTDATSSPPGGDATTRGSEGPGTRPDLATAPPDLDGSGGRSGAAACGTFCARQVELGCSDSTSTGQCRDLADALVQQAPRCREELAAFCACAGEARLSCDAFGEVSAAGCEALDDAVATCLLGF